MRPQDILEHLRVQPFRPIRVTLTDGRTYDVVHPELAMVGHSTVAIGLPRPNAREPVYDRLLTVSLLHIMQIEPIAPVSSQS
jgi:hypothetical protein